MMGVTTIRRLMMPSVEKIHTMAIWCESKINDRKTSFRIFIFLVLRKLIVFRTRQTVVVKKTVRKNERRFEAVYEVHRGNGSRTVKVRLTFVK